VIQSPLLFNYTNLSITNAVNTTQANISLQSASLSLNSFSVNTSSFVSMSAHSNVITSDFYLSSSSRLVLSNDSLLTVDSSTLQGTIVLPDLSAAQATVGASIPIFRALSVPSSLNLTIEAPQLPSAAQSCLKAGYEAGYVKLLITCEWFGEVMPGEITTEPLPFWVYVLIAFGILVVIISAGAITFLYFRRRRRARTASLHSYGVYYDITSSSYQHFANSESGIAQNSRVPEIL